VPLLFRHAHPLHPFLWESPAQPPARWHAAGEGPVTYLADTPDGAWAEFLRHEGITDPEDLAGVARALWAVEVEELPEAVPDLPDAALRGGVDSYDACRAEAARLRAEGADGLVAPSAALEADAAGGCVVDGGLRPAPPRTPHTVVLFGRRPDLVGWRACARGRPHPDLLAAVRHLDAEGQAGAAG